MSDYVPDTGANLQGDDLAPKPEVSQEGAAVTEFLREKYGLSEPSDKWQMSADGHWHVVMPPMPIERDPKHQTSPDCWCHPRQVEPGVFVHQDEIRQ